MRSALLVAAVFVCALPVTAAAQKAENHLYSFAGPAQFGDDRTTYGAVGFEHIGGNGAGVGLELGVLAGEHAQTTSITAVHFVGSRPERVGSRVTPFFLAGIGFLQNPTTDSTLALLVGGGVNVWIKARMALRLDLRLPFLLAQHGGGSAGLGLTIR